MKLTKMSAEELAAFKAEVQKGYDDFKAQGLSLNMARGKPSAEQLDLTEGLLTAVKSNEDCFAEDGTDCRNYGGLDGLPEAKALFAPMLGVTPDELIICGNSSLNIMYDTIAKFMLFGTGWLMSRSAGSRVTALVLLWRAEDILLSTKRVSRCSVWTTRVR